mmetsp:Transcript_54573/g.90698  ORF Transcript_54573/g.90698 Transcript_54573/m.90698 type:complete len:107 (-) Transcript_54573:1950-2270(-)
MISQQPSVSSLVNLPQTIGIAVVTSQEQSASFWYSPTPTDVYEIWLEFVAEKQPSGVAVKSRKTCELGCGIVAASIDRNKFIEPSGMKGVEGDVNEGSSTSRFDQP